MFGTQSQVTETLARTICPTWDQTLIFENVQIYGSIDKVVNNPPEVIIELFDKDPVVRYLTPFVGDTGSQSCFQTIFLSVNEKQCNAFDRSQQVQRAQSTNQN